jgi:AcrR family transcriptional regulator
VTSGGNVRAWDPARALDRLPSGRHRLSREAVRRSQRGRLLLAIVQVVAAKGYGPSTVGDIVERARVSRSTFYEQFTDKEECFIAAFDLSVDDVLARMGEAWESATMRDWRAHVRSDITTYLTALAAAPDFACAMHVEVLAAGPAALERRAQVFARFTERTRRLHELARAEEPSLPSLPHPLFELHTGGMDELIREVLRTRGPSGLPELTEPATVATLALFGDRP